MLFEILRLLLQTFFGLFVLVLLARFWMLFFRINFRNPAGSMVLALSDWMVLPARRVIPSLGGLDLASLFCAWLVQTVLLALLLELQEATFGHTLDISIVTLLLLALLELARSTIYLLIGIVLLQALVSWINPYSTIGPALAPVVRPFYKPFRRYIPPIQGLDLSPVFLLVILQIILILLGGLHTLILQVT